MTLKATDGYEYEDHGAQARFDPLENDRNRQVTRLYDAGYTDEEVRGWAGAYDAPRSASHPERFAQGWRALERIRTRTNSAGRAGIPNPGPSAPAAVHATN